MKKPPAKKIAVFGFQNRFVTSQKMILEISHKI